MTRWVRLDGAVNVRDLGGLPTEDGGTTRTGRIFRSDNLQGLSTDDVRRLTDELGLVRVVDLRTGHEVRQEGPGPLRDAGLDHRHHSLFPEVGESTDVASVDTVTDDPASTEPGGIETSGTETTTADMLGAFNDPDRHVGFEDDPAAGHYLGYLNDAPDQVVGALRALAEPDGAAVVHCAAGKDRTGVVVALALIVAGVRRDAIVADFAASAQVVEQVMARLASTPTYGGDLASRDPSSHVTRPETMARFLSELDARHGGPLEWLAAHEFDADDVARLRSRLRD